MILEFYRISCNIDADLNENLNNYENVIVIFADLLILYACIVNYTFKKYLWKPLYQKIKASKKHKKQKIINYRNLVEKTFKVNYYGF
ncbi:hypothetical protein OD917_03020 [Flavobacterium sp. SH_e]|uniref:hypothetical protein n=1 Tax=Flavobacterium sp. SH_e TaxID=2983767 RepID=UPI0021E3FDFC|nr:hypothetical protein [Flavobacterium sp. SH_e]MCV2483880.1 hypothetical protein [Flavobacterium sp. SH_e]